MLNRCERFARVAARQKGMTYAKAVKKYPRGPFKNTVYVSPFGYEEAHCVHCARAEAILENKPGTGS